MAPRERSVVMALVAFFLAAGPSCAQSDADAQAGIAGIAGLKKQFAPEAQKAELTAPADAPLSVLGQAKINASDLEASGWSKANAADLGPAVTAASRAVRKLHDENPSAVSETFYGNGSMVNIEDSFKWALGFDKKGILMRGCLSHQGVTYAAVSGTLANSSLTVRKISVVRGAAPHHAVIVFPKGSDWKKTGVVFDGWIHQESAPDRMTFLFKDWYGATDWDVSLE